jgi:cytochrome c oxidase accessory protein FixG
MTAGKGAPLDPNRLSMLDQHGHRKFIIPAEVRGRYVSWKIKVQVVLMLLFLLLPWVHIGGDQAILLDIPGRHFIFFGLHLDAHDAPLMFLIVLAFISGLALVTALWGRVWCGWACPQTVFIERVYRQIEIWVEGSYIERRRLLTAPWSWGKLRRQSLKWALYVLVSSLIAHSFLAYWTGSHELLAMMQRPPSQNWTYFLWVSAITGILLFNFAWFREQFCLIVCPYGKFQSTLLDSHSITVMYDEKRGEPRKSATVDKSRQGDCVSCQRCVQVCPTGIDIRNGIQMECIGCTACMDACDEIMTKVKKPTGLIRYKALTDKKIQWLRGRVLSYAALFIGSWVVLSAVLILRTDLRIEILRGKDTPFVVVDRRAVGPAALSLVEEEGAAADAPSGAGPVPKVGAPAMTTAMAMAPKSTSALENVGKEWVQNHFILRLENLAGTPKEITFQVPENQVEMVLPENPIRLGSNEKKDLPLIMSVPITAFSITGQTQVTVTFTEGHQKYERKVPLLGPFRNSN